MSTDYDRDFTEENEEKYYFHFCWDGRKDRKAWTDIVGKEVFDNYDLYGLWYDILDYDDRQIWFDYGDQW